MPKLTKRGYRGVVGFWTPSIKKESGVRTQGALTWVGDDDCLDEALSVSHVSPRTSLDVLRASATVKKPETFS